MEFTAILVQIRKIVRSINLESKRFEKQYGISIPQYLCLVFLNDQENKQATASELKAYLNLNASTVTGILARLEKKNRIGRIPNPEDKRSSLISLREEGRIILEKSPELLQEKLAHKLARIHADEQIQIQQALDKLVGFMEIENVDASPILTAEGKIEEFESE